MTPETQRVRETLDAAQQEREALRERVAKVQADSEKNGRYFLAGRRAIRRGRTIGDMAGCIPDGDPSDRQAAESVGQRTEANTGRPPPRREGRKWLKRDAV